jgi:hypothetical protein
MFSTLVRIHGCRVNGLLVLGMCICFSVEKSTDMNWFFLWVFFGGELGEACGAKCHSRCRKAAMPSMAESHRKITVYQYTRLTRCCGLDVGFKSTNAFWLKERAHVFPWMRGSFLSRRRAAKHEEMCLWQIITVQPVLRRYMLVT